MTSENGTPATIPHMDITDPPLTSGDVRVEMGSGVRYTEGGEKVVISQPGVPIVAQAPDPNRKPKDFVITNVIVIFLCNFIAGIIGCQFGVKSNWAWKLGDEHVARKHAKVALICAIVGVCLGVITYCLAFGLYFGLPSRKPISVTHGQAG